MMHNPWSMNCGRRIDGEPYRDGEVCLICEGVYIDVVDNEPDILVDALANLLAIRRTGGSVYMDGEHNPTPSEILAAKRFVQEWDIVDGAKLRKIADICDKHDGLTLSIPIAVIRHALEQ